MSFKKKKLSNWGNFPEIECYEHNPGFGEDLEYLIDKIPSLIPRGNGRCYGDASLSPHVVSSLKLNHIISFDPDNATITCEAGILLSDILHFIVPKGFFLPITPGTKYITLGGAIAADVHGKNHHVGGCFSECVISFQLINDEGKRIHCSRNENSDLFALTCGGMGLTGFIYSATIHLLPIETSFIRYEQFKTKTLDELFALFESSQNWKYSVSWIDCMTGKGKGLNALFSRGEHALKDELSNGKVELLPLSKKGKLEIPSFFPSILLNQITVRLFNILYYRKQFRNAKHGIMHYDPFFYPLDKLHHWNRIYGKKGFLQYQFVLPYKNSRSGLLEIIDAIRTNRKGSFLTVLKLFGDIQSIGDMSFPIKGYTLAIDFKMEKGIMAFLDQLDMLVAKHNGKVYLAKDARMEKEFFNSTYKGIDTIKNKFATFDQKSKFTSVQSNRLQIK
jgi:decaprenylphospho-beta-D-ribofuranose 2-oxidase